MSVGNLNTQGDKRNNFAYQLAMLKLLEQVVNNTAGSSADYETRTTTFEALPGSPTIPGVGYAPGDIIVRYDIIDMATGTIVQTVWFNQTAQTTLTGAGNPNPVDLTPIAGSSSVTVVNGPGAAAVNIQDGGNSITVDNPNLDAPISNLNLEATQLLIQGLLTTIDGDTSNLDVALSTRASETTLATMLTLTGFEARINTLGQKAMVDSTPVVLASDQSAIPVTQTNTVRTPGFISDTGAGTVTAGKRSVSVYNSGGAAGIWLGTSLPRGAQLNFEAGAQGDTLAAFTYDATGTTFLITTIV